MLALMILASAFAADPRMILHLRADTGVVTNATNRVTHWTDLSGRGTHFMPPLLAGTSDTSLCPSFAQIPGHSQSIYFNGTNGLMDTTSLPLDSGFTFLATIQDNFPSSQSALFDKSRNDIGINLWDAASGYFTLSWSWNQTIATSFFNSTKPRVYNASWDGVTGNLRVDDSLLSRTQTKAPSTATRNKFAWLGGVSYSKGILNDWSAGLNGHLWEVRIYQGILSDSLRKVITDSMKARILLPELPIGKSEPELMLHLRADTGLVLDSLGRVSLWSDLSSRHSHFVTPLQSGSTNMSLRPIPKPTGIGGRASIKFNGRNALQDTTSLPLDSGATIFIVAQDSSGKNAYTGLLDKGANDLALALWAGEAGNLTFGYSWLGGLASSTYDSAAPTLYGVVWNTSSAKLYTNGLLLDAAVVDTNTQKRSRRNKTTTLGAALYSGGLDYYLKGSISEVRVYRGALGDSTRKTIEDSLSAKYLGQSSGTGIRNVHAANSTKPAFVQQGKIHIAGAKPLRLSTALGKRISFLQTADASGITIVPQQYLRSGHYLLETDQGIHHLVVLNP